MIAGHRPAERVLSFALPPRRANIKPGSQILWQLGPWSSVWRNLESVIDHDALSDGHATVHTTRLANCRARQGGATSSKARRVVGDHRRSNLGEGGRRLGLDGTATVAFAAAGALLVGGGRRPRCRQRLPVDGHPAWKVTFFDPSTPGWYSILVDKATSRTVSVRMIATAHFMHDEYSGFDAPLSITPPRNVQG